MRQAQARFWLLPAGVAAVLLAIIAAWLLRDLVREALVEPAAYLFWLAGRVIRSWPQPQVWAAVTLVALVNVMLLLLRVIRLSAENTAEAVEAGPVANWLEWLHLGRQRSAAEKMLVRKLRVLVFSALMHGEQRPSQEIWAQLRAGRLPLTPELQQYLQDGQITRGPSHLPAVTKQPVQQPREYVAPEVEAIVQFLEDYLEGDYER